MNISFPPSSYSHSSNSDRFSCQAKQAGQVAASFEMPQEKAGARSCSDAGGAADRVDFSHMTGRQLWDWMNTQLREGKMTLDESTSYLAMTINGMPADGSDVEQAYLDVPRDYFKIVTTGIEGAQWRGDLEATHRLQEMLVRMRAEG